MARLESPTTGATLFTFSKTHIAGNRGWERRNASFTVANTPWGSSPFLSIGAPAAPHRWKWAARFIPSVAKMSGDAIIDTLNLALDLGRQTRLVYIHDDGYERLNEAVGYLGDAPIDSTTDGHAYDLSVEWELLGYWHERSIVNTPHHLGAGWRLGQTSPAIRMGTTSTAQITAPSFSVPTTMCDASTAGPSGLPTASDSTAVIQITGPYGGDGGFIIQNFAPQGSVVVVFLKLLFGDTLTLDFGAKDYLLNRNGTTTDVSQFVLPTNQFGYDFLVQASSTNPILLTCLGANPTYLGSFVCQWRRLFS